MAGEVTYVHDFGSCVLPEDPVEILGPQALKVERRLNPLTDEMTGYEVPDTTAPEGRELAAYYQWVESQAEMAYVKGGNLTSAVAFSEWRAGLA